MSGYHVYKTPNVIVPPSPIPEPPSTLVFTGRTLSVPANVTGGANVLLDIAWSDFDNSNYIRKGTRITTSDGGLAVVIVDPQYQSNILSVLMINPFFQSSYSDPDVSLLLPVEADPVKYIPNPFRYQTRVLPDYFAIVRETVLNDITDAIVRLGNLRRWDKCDSEFLNLAIQEIGGFFDTVMFDDEAKRRILLELPNFYTYNITEKYILFLSFLMNTYFRITPLWTNDYKNFIAEPITNTTSVYSSSFGPVTISYKTLIGNALDSNAEGLRVTNVSIGSGGSTNFDYLNQVVIFTSFVNNNVGYFTHDIVDNAGRIMHGQINVVVGTVGTYDSSVDAKYYPTNHLYLSYDQTLYPPPDLTRLTSLFYDLSPVPFVLQALYTVLTGTFKYTVAAYFRYPSPIRIGTNLGTGVAGSLDPNPLGQPLA